MPPSGLKATSLTSRGYSMLKSFSRMTHTDRTGSEAERSCTEMRKVATASLLIAFALIAGA
jgi:hypothetical protein